METRATVPHLNPNGIARMNIASVDLELIQHLSVKWIRLVPSAQLEVMHIKARFGQPEHTIASQEGAQLLLYPQIGLQVLVRADGKDELAFVQHATFNESNKALDVSETPQLLC